MDIIEVRKALADYMATEGCSCCEREGHHEAAMRLGELLGIPAYTDGSGIDFWHFCSEEAEDDTDPGDMDGDHETALASAGWGTDEDYGG